MAPSSHSLKTPEAPPKYTEREPMPAFPPMNHLYYLFTLIKAKFDSTKHRMHPKILVMMQKRIHTEIPIWLAELDYLIAKTAGTGRPVDTLNLAIVLEELLDQLLVASSQRSVYNKKRGLISEIHEKSLWDSIARFQDLLYRDAKGIPIQARLRLHSITNHLGFGKFFVDCSEKLEVCKEAVATVIGSLCWRGFSLLEGDPQYRLGIEEAAELHAEVTAIVQELRIQEFEGNMMEDLVSSLNVVAGWMTRWDIEDDGAPDIVLTGLLWTRALAVWMVWFQAQEEDEECTVGELPPEYSRSRVY